MFLLACDNAMQGVTSAYFVPAIPSLSFQSVADLTPVGLVVAAIVLHFFRHRWLTRTDRALVLVLGSLAGALVGAISGLEFRLSGLGLFAIPLFPFALMWLETEARLSHPHYLPERVWPIDRGKNASKRSASKEAP